MNVYIEEPQQQAIACVIWMHGLGADGNDMRAVVKQLPMDAPVRHVFLDAPVRPVTLNNHMPMRAWYDIVGFKLTDRQDREGLLQSEGMIRQIIENQVIAGLKHEQIFLAGFSQGGAMALFTGLRSPVPLAGVITLSGYLPLQFECEQESLNTNLSVFVAGGAFDPIVLPDWTQQSVDWLQSRGFQQITRHEYPMEHSICAAEIRDLIRWLTAKISSITQRIGVTE